MSDAEPPEPFALTVVLRDALVGRLLADLAADSAASSVSAALRGIGALDTGGIGGGVPADLAALGADPSRRRIARALLERYRLALERAPRGVDLETRLEQARALFAAGLFFEVHEVLEPAWRSAAGEDKRILQGIIQAAVGWHHGDRGRTSPALRAAGAAASKLAAAPERWNGFPIAELRALLDGYREAVTRGDAPRPPRMAE